MGSVQTAIDCPQCGNPHCMEDYYYKTFEVYIFCNRCGYHKKRELKYDDKQKLLLKCPFCGHEEASRTRKARGKIRNYCRKCNRWFRNIYDCLQYDEVEEHGKGSIIIAGIIFECPHCKHETVPDKRDNEYFCRHCEKKIDEETVKSMHERRKVSGVQSVIMIPATETEEEINNKIDQMENDIDTEIIEITRWGENDGKRK